MLKKIVIAVLALSSMALARSAAAADVPARYAQLYDGLERLLDAAGARWRSSSAPSDGFRPIYSTDLLAANSNRGRALLQPDTLPTVRLSLDRFKAMGIQNVKFALQYPLLRPDFPRAPEYLALPYQELARRHNRFVHDNQLARFGRANFLGTKRPVTGSDTWRKHGRG